MPKVKVALMSRDHAPTYFRKASEFCAAAASALAAERHDAALLCAIHAGISAADAVCVALGGRRSMDPDHQRAVDLLEEVGARTPEMRTKRQQLRGLLALKNLVEYETRAATAAEAADGAKRCERLVDWARSELANARLL